MDTWKQRAYCSLGQRIRLISKYLKKTFIYNNYISYILFQSTKRITEFLCDHYDSVKRASDKFMVWLRILAAKSALLKLISQNKSTVLSSSEVHADRNRKFESPSNTCSISSSIQYLLTESWKSIVRARAMRDKRILMLSYETMMIV